MMRKIFIVILVIFSLLLAGCSSKTENSPDASKMKTFTASELNKYDGIS